MQFACCLDALLPAMKQEPIGVGLPPDSKTKTPPTYKVGFLAV